MSRLRVVFEKRGFACFVRHVELPQLFGRIARRAECQRKRGWVAPCGDAVFFQNI